MEKGFCWKMGEVGLTFITGREAYNKRKYW